MRSRTNIAPTTRRGFVQIGRESGVPEQQNKTKKYTVFGSVEAINALADAACNIVLYNEVELDKIDEDGGHFKVADYGCQAFEMLAANYGLSVQRGVVV